MNTKRPRGDSIGGVIADNVNSRKHQIREAFSRNFARRLDEMNSGTPSGMRHTAKSLAVKAGIKEWDISKFRRMTLTPSVADVQRLAAAMDIDPDDLVPGYCSPAHDRGFAMTMSTLRNGNIWIEFSGAFEPADAREISRLLVRRTDDRKPA